jgi:hypothetical protein
VQGQRLFETVAGPVEVTEVERDEAEPARRLNSRARRKWSVAGS